MNRLFLILTVLTCTLVGGCAESMFYLSRSSALPQGFRADEEAQRAAKSASRIELWLYTYDPPELKFFTGPVDVILSRDGCEYRNTKDGFSIEFNGVETRFRFVASPNVIEVEEDLPDTTRPSR